MAPPLVPLLEQILTQTPSMNKTNPQLLTQAAWLAGCLLVDAGVENHPSTAVAAPVLIPALMERIGTSSEGQQSGQTVSTMLSFEEERELVSALWNALAWPPQLDFVQHHRSSSAFGSGSSQRPPPAHLSFALNISRPTVQTLIRLVTSNDSDAVLASVSVIELILRLHPDESKLPSYDLLTMMQEEEVVDALEKVCDSPMEDAAELAADILDDYFYNADQDDDHYDQQNPGNYSWMQISEDAGHLPSFGVRPSATEHVVSRESPSGMGRGRGATLPAWMSKS
jgi:hypothetical protein